MVFNCFCFVLFFYTLDGHELYNHWLLRKYCWRWWGFKSKNTQDMVAVKNSKYFLFLLLWCVHPTPRCIWFACAGHRFHIADIDNVVWHCWQVFLLFLQELYNIILCTPAPRGVSRNCWYRHDYTMQTKSQTDEEKHLHHDCVCLSVCVCGIQEWKKSEKTCWCYTMNVCLIILEWFAGSTVTLL